ncbi:MAG TPA: WYL domain-containing protein [Phycisphaeraceae bacterium]|nr:WYL domain-containing protein [Phycisphaeraceae bacterium]
MAQERLIRLVRVLTLLQEGKALSSSDLAEKLNVTPRTIFRDLHTLEQAGILIEYRGERGYELKDSVFATRLPLSPSELISLLLLRSCSAVSANSPFMRSATEIIDKLAKNTMGNTAEKLLRSVPEIISHDRFALGIPEGELSWFATLLTACIEKRVCSMKYEYFSNNTRVSTGLHPYHLHSCENSWYVIGHSTTHGEIRTFKVCRIYSLDLLEESFTPPRRFDIQSHLKGAWRLIPDGETYDVQVEFSPAVARRAAEQQWHYTQQQAMTPDGRCIMNFRVSGLDEIKEWILRFGAGVYVRKPLKLRQMVVDSARNILEQYRPEVVTEAVSEPRQSGRRP